MSREFPRIWDVEMRPRDAAGVAGFFAYSSHARDDIEARVVDPGTIHLTMFSGTSLSGAMEIATLSIVLRNEDGALDFLRTYAFDGCRVVVTVYDQRDNTGADPGRTDITPISGLEDTRDQCELLGEQALFDESIVTIVCRDYRHKLDQQLLYKKYAGTNAGAPLAGIDGTANDLKGRGKPFLVGSVFNITPDLVNTDKRIYTIEGRYPFSIPFDTDGLSHPGGLVTGYTLTVMDKRSPITRGADYISQTDMEANVPAASQVRVWPAGASFRLGSVPVGMVTCDVENPPYAGNASTLQAVCHRLVRVADKNLTPGAFEAAWAANPKAGIYLKDDSISVLSALEQALASVGAFITDRLASMQSEDFSLGGPFFFQLNAPESLPYVPQFAPVEIDRSNMVPGTTLQQLAIPGASRGTPVWRINVNYKRNYTVMTAADLAGVAAADAEFCKKEWRTVTAEDAAVLTRWPDAIEMTVNTLLVNQADAQAEANRLLALFSEQREMYRCRIKGWAVRRQIAPDESTYSPGNFTCTSLVNLTYPRFGMDAGRLFVTVALDMNLQADEYDVVVWG